jgi:simple sugar transport system ATP-binding protein
MTQESVWRVNDSTIVGPPVAEAIRVSKRFGANQALRDVSLTVAPGESRALVGRNGAGKSTLVGVLTGLLASDAGRIRLGDEDAPRLADRGKWRSRVACVYQKSTVIPTLTVAENLLLNAHPTIVGDWISWRALQDKAQSVLEEWGLEVDIDLDAGRLNVEQRQIVEIARALFQGTRFIILDEPTAELEGREAARLFDRITRLQKSGVAFLYISHYLEEIYEVCHTVSVLRDGALVAGGRLAEMSKEQIVAAMVGDVGQYLRTNAAQPKQPGHADEPPLLDVRNLLIAGAVEDISFRVAPSECLGLAGLASSGKEEVGYAIAGLIAQTAGEIFIDGERLDAGDVITARNLGVGYVPRDRHAHGILPQLGVSENLTITIPERLGKWGLISPATRDRLGRQMIDDFGIVTSSCEQPISELSGGNQQKTVMGRALASNPRVLVLSHPTQGVDIASKQALFDIVASAQAEGMTVLVITDDLDELVICDRVLTMFRGRLVAEFGRNRRDTQIVAAIEGFERNE